MDICFFFFKEKTAFGVLRGLVGLEKCIRDRNKGLRFISPGLLPFPAKAYPNPKGTGARWSSIA